jgi:hypothetical protein
MEHGTKVEIDAIWRICTRFATIFTKKLLVFVFLFSYCEINCQEVIFKENEVIKYLVKYETERVVTIDTVRIFVTGNMWKAAPKTSKEIVILYDLTNIEMEYFLDIQTIGWVPTDTTGAVENENTCWFHPPRHNQFMMLELAPFPRVEFPLEVGKTYTKVLFIGEGWGDISNSKVYWRYEVKENNAKTWIISSEARPTIYPFEINRLDIVFDETDGFTRLDYSFNNGTQITMTKID